MNCLATLLSPDHFFLIIILQLLSSGIHSSLKLLGIIGIIQGRHRAITLLEINLQELALRPIHNKINNFLRMQLNQILIPQRQIDHLFMINGSSQS